MAEENGRKENGDVDLSDSPLQEEHQEEGGGGGDNSCKCCLVTVVVVVSCFLLITIGGHFVIRYLKLSFKKIFN